MQWAPLGNSIEAAIPAGTSCDKVLSASCPLIGESNFNGEAFSSNTRLENGKNSAKVPSLTDSNLVGWGPAEIAAIEADGENSTEYEKTYHLNVDNQPFVLVPYFPSPYGYYNIREQHYTGPITGTTTQIYNNSVVRVTDPSTGQAYIVGPNGYFYRQVDTDPTNGTTNANWSYYYDNPY